MSPAPAVKLALWLVAALVAATYGPSFVRVLVPPAGVYLDFVQEWLSARNFWAGDPVYLPLREALQRRTGIDEPDFDRVMRWNAHPPAAVLVALPLGLIPDYRTAHLAWAAATFPLFLVSLIVIARELRLPLAWWSVPPLLVLAVTSFPVMTQVGQGQLNFVLFPLLVAGWVADRRGYQLGSGIAVGMAAAIKLFPGFVFVYLLFARRWRAVVAGAFACVAMNGLALAAFGIDAFTTYVREVVPSLEVFRTSWRNVSLAGFWARVLRGQPEVATALTLASQLTVAGIVAWMSLRAHSRDERDRAFAAAVVGMLLASPVAWPHYFLFLLIPAGLLAARLAPGAARWIFLLLLPIFWLPDTTFATLAMGNKSAAEIAAFRTDPPGVAASLTGLAVFNYALVSLFALVACGRFTTNEPEA